MPQRVLDVVEYSPFEKKLFSAARSSEMFSKACFCCHLLCTPFTNRLLEQRLKSDQLNEPNLLYHLIGRKRLFGHQTLAYFWMGPYRLKFLSQQKLDRPFLFYFSIVQMCIFLKMCSNHILYLQFVDQFCCRSYAIYYRLYMENIQWCQTR